MDISMPVMDGVQTTEWLKKNLPGIRVLALSMMDDDTSVIRMIRAGARGYVLKDVEPRELRKAIRDIAEKGYYYSELVSGKVIQSLQGNEETKPAEQIARLTDREMEFLKLCCSELSYKQIANTMHVSPRTVDGYRDSLFEKLEAKSRVGLVLYAVKTKLA
jgi:DNA-binding NarL/FixJ family response regulator